MIGNTDFQIAENYNRRGAGLRLLCGSGGGYGAVFIHNSFVCKRKAAEVIYIEIDNAYKVNAVLKELEREIPESFTYQIFAPKSGNQGSVGLNVVIDKRIDMDVSGLSSVENIVFAVEE